MATTMATKITVVLDNDLDAGPKDKTVRSGMGGADYEIDLSDGGRIPASIVQQYQAATGGRCRRPSASLTRTNARRPVNEAR
jgi:hypothetical protein